MSSIQQIPRQIDYKTMRIIVGLIALLLSPTVLLLSDYSGMLPSISYSYWTDARDIFVGSLIIVGFFLSAYNGSGNGRDREYIISKLACICAIFVALFPTERACQRDTDTLANWVHEITEFVGIAPEYIHFGAAIILFICLVVLMWFFSLHAKSKGSIKRAYCYRAISLLMVLGMAVLYILGKSFELEYTILLVEIWGLTLFAIGWLKAGMYKSRQHVSG